MHRDSPDVGIEPPVPEELADPDVFRQLLDAAPDASIVTDGGGRIVLVNVKAEQMFGYTRAELIGQPVEILIPERFRANHVSHRNEYASAPKARPMGSGLELFGRKRDGSEFFVEISLAPLQTRRGTLTSAGIRDITQRKHNELRIRRLQDHLLSALESIQGSFLIFDQQDRLVLCNSTAREVLGSFLTGEIVGRQFAELIETNLAAGTFDVSDSSVAELRARCLSYHRDPSGSLALRTSEGRHLLLVERRTLDGGTVATLTDVSDEVAQRDELRSARAMAEAASAAKSEFLASMSHELRTPLNSILGFAQLLQRDKKNPLGERQLERIDHVLKGGQHLLRLIDEVLDLSRIEAGMVTVSLEPVDVAEVLREVKATLDPMAARSEVALTVAPVPSSLPKVIADRTRFKQVLMNFASNAIKYGRARGNALLQVKRDDKQVRVSVKDDGIGIPTEKQGKIFQPFQRAGQETGPIEGTGIGLVITKRLAELMQGSVGFRSEEAQGSEFWIELKVFEGDEIASQGSAAVDFAGGAVLMGAEGPRYLVVYIEDNPSNIAFMEDLLSEFERVSLVTAPTAEIGIELVRARRPNLVIMDINLPGMSGFEATRRLRQWPETREIPVIALSAAAMVRDADRVKEAGFYRYLTKPVQVDELAGVLAELLSPQASAAD